MWNSPVSEADKISPTALDFCHPLRAGSLSLRRRNTLLLDLWALAGKCPGWLITALNDSALIHTSPAWVIEINTYIRVPVEFATASSNIDTLDMLGRDLAEAEPGNQCLAAFNSGL